jgi:hypothetical protein
MFTSYFPNQISTLFLPVPRYIFCFNQNSKGPVCWIQDSTLKIFGMENKEENAGADRSILLFILCSGRPGVGEVWLH